MRNLFQSKNHKKVESIRLQQELQREEERLFKIEQAKRKILQTRDEEFARRLQQQLELEEEESSPPRAAPSPEQRRPPPPQPQPEPLTDEEFARRLQEELNAEEEHQGQCHSPPLVPPPKRPQVNQTLSDEEYARQLQEQFEFEERELQREQQLSQPSSPQQHQQYAMPAPVLPPRAPAYSSGTTMPLPSIPSKPAAYHQHSSSIESFPRMTQSTSIAPSLTPSTSYNTTNWAQNSGQHQQQPLFTSTAVSSSVQQPLALDVGGVDIHPYPPIQAASSPSAYHPPPRASSPVMHHPSSPSAPILTAPFFMPMASSPHITAREQHQHQKPHEASSSGIPLYPSYSNLSPDPTHQQGYLPQEQQQQQQHQPHAPDSPLSVITALPQDNQAPPYPIHTSPHPYHQSTYPQAFAPPHSQSAGPSALTSAPAPKSPVMFVVPTPIMESAQPQYQTGHSQQQIPSYVPMPTLEQHMPPVNDCPPSAMYPYPPLPVTSSPVQQHHSPVQQRQLPGASAKGKARYRDPTPPPVRFTQRPPGNDEEKLSPHGSKAASDAPAPPLAGFTWSPDNGAGVSTGDEHRRTQDPFADENKADGYSSEEDEYEEHTETKPPDLEEKPPAAFFKVKTKSTLTAPSQPEQNEFNPVDYVHEDDLIDLNEPEQYSSDDDGSSDDGSVELNNPELISTESGAVGTQTDPTSTRDSEASKSGLDLMGHGAENATPPAPPSSEKENTNDVETQKKKEEAKATTRDNRAEIQRRLAEQMKKQGGFTRVDPTFGMNMTPPPSRSIESNKQEEATSEEERVKIDKVAEDTEEYYNTPAMATPPFLHPQPAHTPSNIHMVFGQHTHSASSLILPGTGHLQHQRPASPYANHHESYDNSYMAAPMVYPENLVKAGAPPGIMPPGMPIETTNEVPSGDYGYYLVDNSGPTKEDENKAPKPSLSQEPNKKLPNIPSSDPNHRHITVPSVNPGQRVWIRVKPTDTGKDLAQRIHVVATYKSKKILSIKSTNGRLIPIDDTPVFQDWNEIVKLEDGAPWEVEWGPMEHSILAGMDFLKQIKASLRSKDN